MKTNFTFLLLFLSICTLQASELPPNISTVLYAHLTEVNQEWQFQKDLPPTLFKENVTFQSDIERIQTHLKLVEQVLKKRDVSHLNKEQQANRARHLNVLNEYWEASIFPTNTFHANRQPYFVDIFGVHCAVGYLLHRDGQDDFVQTIKNENNYAYIAELQVYPALKKWAINNGFTLNELAWIQPGYGGPIYKYNEVGNNGGVNGKIHVMKSNPDSTLLIIGGDFTTVDGAAANGIIAWNGTGWTNFGTQLDGTVYDVAWDAPYLIAVGDFKIGNTISNIARWDGTSWTSLQNGDMGGAIYTILSTPLYDYIGGDFTLFNGQPMPYLARKKYNTGFNNYYNTFSVNAPVKCIREVAGQILIGGEFTETAPNSLDSTQQITANYLAYWDRSNFKWTSGLNGTHGPVNTFMEHDGKLYVAGNVNDANPVSVLELGLWTSLSGFSSFVGNGDFERFFKHQDQLFLTGDFTYTPSSFLGNGGTGIVKLYDDDAEGFSSMDSVITAGASFKQEVYLGGRFTQIGSYSINQLASSDFVDLHASTNTIAQKNPFQVFYNNARIILKTEKATQSMTFQLVNELGQVIQTETITAGQNRRELPVDNLRNGVYFYVIYNDELRQSGKLAMF